MDIYAYVSIVEVALKFIMILVVKFLLFDKLKIYGILICGVTIINTIIYGIICKIKYKECKFGFYWNKILFKEIIHFSTISLAGSVAIVLRNQGINILLNQFFGVNVISARSIAYSINNAVSGLMNNFTQSISPSLTKDYAAGEKEKVLSLLFFGSKCSWFLMFVFTLPMLLELPFVLSLWLNNLPEYTVIFSRLILIEILISSILIIPSYLVMAAGKIKLYQFIVSIVSLFNLPLSYLVLILGLPPFSVGIVMVCLTIVIVIVALIIATYYLKLFSFRLFLFNVVLPICTVLIIAFILPAFFRFVLKQSFLRLFIVVSTSIVSSCFFMYIFGLNIRERTRLNNIISNKFKRPYL
ncbi:hypothetical protein AGMMS50268_12760 [Spirochaetia bacterium]|nr:hypothetical protein AGMMS50268_12760 [Spirochaetia bacterium]